MFLPRFVIFLCLLVPARAAGQRTVAIAAASDLRAAMDSLILRYQTSNPTFKATVTYGSSGKFFEQITHGAPFDIFFSADLNYPESLRKKGLARDVVKYGTGSLVLWSRTFPVTSLDLLLDPRVTKVAIANPAHAPYGMRAVEVLKSRNLYEAVAPRLVYGENISQAAHFVSTGGADVGIIALSLALSPEMKRMNGRFWAIPHEWHRPLDQGFAILGRARDPEAAAAFAAFVGGSEGRAILKHFGFN